MQNYKPNFKEQRTNKRTQQIIEWVEKHIGAETKILHSKILRSPEAFGNSSLGIYLKNNLLVKTCPAYKPGEFSQQYRINIDYLNRLRSELGLSESHLRHNRLEQRFANAADHIASGDFPMNDNGLRWYDGLQYIPRELKPLMWGERGYIYDYDVECCAPTLLVQQARKLNPKMKSLDYINFYLTNKNIVRDELSIKYNLSNMQVKQLINGLFQGGILNSYKDNKIFVNVFNKNFNKMIQVKQDAYLIELIKDISYMWKQLRKDINIGYYYSGDVRKQVRITGRDKSSYYQKLERIIMTPVWKYLKKKSVRVHPEHDGFRSDQFVVPDELEQMILFETGFHVKFKWTKIENTDNNV